jgi:hypothetical protein
MGRRTALRFAALHHNTSRRNKGDIMQNDQASFIAELEERIVPSTAGEGPMPGLIVLGIFMIAA